MVLAATSLVHRVVLGKQLVKGFNSTTVDTLERHRWLRRSCSGLGGKGAEFRV